MRKDFVIASIFTLVLQALLIYLDHRWVWALSLTLPLIGLGVYEMFQTKHTLMRNYPLLGRFRYLMEELRPKIYQYFIESDTDGTPINRISRAVVYQRAKKDVSTTPFGTQLDVYQIGYEWINHSMNALSTSEFPNDNLRVMVGKKNCSKPYSLSIFNISAMSYGALSPHAIEALNWGAKLGGFAHNTGEGAISAYHKKHGGDLIWQIGTGLFGCRTPEGKFSEEKFCERATSDQVKMIEIKLSQGAKPGHGGILPAGKNNPEIALIRGVTPYTSVISPPRHSSFSNHYEMLHFIQKLRDLSGGKPVGIKLCFGSPNEFEDLCKTMIETNITPDFITIDGGEGGTGAAPLEFSNSVGMPLRDGLIWAHNLLLKYNLKESITLIASGKILNGFDVVKVLAIGADACYSARGMMLALGCIQALVCNRNTCPTGVATQDPTLYKGLNVKDKHVRVANFHEATLHSAAEIVGAAGLNDIRKLERHHIWRRVSTNEIKNYEQLYPYPTQNGRGELKNASSS